MIKKLKYHLMTASAAGFIGLVSGVESAFAQKNMTTIVENIGDSIEGVPGLISGVSYMMGILFGVLGILKIKDHVENPSSAPLQQGAIRLAAGGGLFALPIVYEAMRNTIGNDGELVSAPKIKALEMKVQ